MGQFRATGLIIAIVIVLASAWMWPSDSLNVNISPEDLSHKSIIVKPHPTLQRVPASVAIPQRENNSRLLDSNRDTSIQQTENAETEKILGEGSPVEASSSIANGDDESHNAKNLSQISPPDEPLARREIELDNLQIGTTIFGAWQDQTKLPKPTPGTANSGESSTSSPLVCSSSLAVGSYDFPQEVTLSCSSNANIRFCVSEGTCCDPTITGTSYSSPIIIGQEEKSYCLAIEGVGVNGSSHLREYTYSFSRNTTIQASVSKTQIQTTELPNSLILTSDGLMHVGFEFSVLNLFTHDISPSGHNWGCSEIYSNFSMLSFPTVAVPLAPIAGNTITSAPLEIALNKSDLASGENQLISFVVNRNYTTESFGCQKTDIIVEDFPYFDSHPSHGYSGSNDVREFSAGFTPYGAFGTQTQVGRGPASKHYETVGEQELRSGIFAIFH